MSTEKKQEKNEQDKINAAEEDFLSADPMEHFKNDKPSTKSPKKKVIGIVCGAVIVAVLAGGIVAINISGVGKSSKENTTSASDTTDPNAITLFKDCDVNNVKTVKVTNGDTKFTVYRKTNKKGDDAAVFSIKGYDKYNLDNDIVSTLANNMMNFTTYDTIKENADDLSIYGLDDKHAIKATLTMDNGTKKSYRIGNVTADSTYTYFCIDGEKTVYTAESSKLNNYTYKPLDFVSKTVIKSLDEKSKTYVKSVDIKRNDIDYEIKLNYDKKLAKENDKKESDSSSSTAMSGAKTVDLKMVSPVEANLNPEKSDKTVNGIYGLSAEEAVMVAPSDSDLAKYGLDNPQCTATIKSSDKKTYIVKIGNEIKDDTENSDNDENETSAESPTSSTESNESYYVYVEGGPDVVYKINSDSLPWMTVKAGDITARIIISGYVWDVATLDVSAPGHDTMKFLGSGTDKDDYVVTLNGKKCESERFRQFYAFLIKEYGEEVVTDGEQPKGDPILSVTYSMQRDDTTKHTIKFYDCGHLKTLITIDGRPTFKCRKSFVDSVTKNMDIFDSNKTLIDSWE